MNEVIVVINTGSSSIKFSVFSYQKRLDLLYHGEVSDIFDSPRFTIFNEFKAAHILLADHVLSAQGHEAGLHAFFDWFEQLQKTLSKTMLLKAVGHRVVHGGMYFSSPVLINDDVIKKIGRLIPLAPLHQPLSIKAIEIIKTRYPTLPQIACFDTAFHHTQEKLATLFAIPRHLTEEGVIRYGFHGISYEYIASVINRHIGKVGNKRVIVAHLGNGASMCAMYQRKSIATSMGFTPLDGLMMGTRCGDIDPGVLLYLLKEKKYSADQLEHLLYSESGMLGVSGVSADVRKLLSASEPSAKEAIELFCYRAVLEIGRLSAALQGFDALIFTAGIGENSAIIREKICQQLGWLGIKINKKANDTHAPIISKKSSALVTIIPTNEERMIAEHTYHLIYESLEYEHTEKNAGS